MTAALRHGSLEGKSNIDFANDALDRMKRAHDRGTGCHLTADMIAGLGVTMIAECWSEERPETDQ